MLKNADMWSMERIAYLLLYIQYFVMTEMKDAVPQAVGTTFTVNGVTYVVTGIAEKAFSGRKKIKTIVIPETITSIQKKAFADCSKLEKIIIRSEKLKDQNLDQKAFEGVKEDVTIQVPKKKLSGYRKLFVKKGLDRKVECKAIKAKKQ